MLLQTSLQLFAIFEWDKCSERVDIPCGYDVSVAGIPSRPLANSMVEWKKSYTFLQQKPECKQEIQKSKATTQTYH